jgi:hypothetical protein
VRIEERSGYSSEERPLANAPRIMTHIGDLDRFVTGKLGLDFSCELFDRYGFVH